MNKKMLIDATQSEETRVGIVAENRLEDFDFESKVIQQIKGNIYLVKVTRVEPSLQAAFFDYKGNRHGFLPFTEIHPDYFRIPTEDRQKLLEQERAELEARAAQEEDEEDEAIDADGTIIEGTAETAEQDEDEDLKPAPSATSLDDDEDEDEDEDDAEDEDEDESLESENGNDDFDADSEASEARRPDQDGDQDSDEDRADDESVEGESADGEQAEGTQDGESQDDSRRDGRGRRNRRGRGRRFGKGGKFSRPLKQKSGDSVEEDVEASKQRFRISHRQYKIQEVIKRSQIMLVQITKEERGNKGAAATTYISLPGRYCVLMPNSTHGGGVSRKISNPQDRRKMKELLRDLEVPEGMSVILRTAGIERTKLEIKKDLEYLLRLWDNIRETTMNSTAPAAIYKEADLIQRSIRDLYSKDISEVVVSGEEGYKRARDFMKMLMPSHVRRIKQYKEEKIPLFHRYQVEKQIEEIFSPVATMPSGGYIVIHPTEALVSIDVNSGKSTRERHIEGTALQTNLEAAEEVARQLRLRDLGGLVVVDFIDMEDYRNNRAVERRMRELLKQDRARVQITRISDFGLMEISRQRLRPSLVETNFVTCPHCEGTGLLRTVETAALVVLRGIEEEGIRGRYAECSVTMQTEVALYILNHKRSIFEDIEKRHDFRVLIQVDPRMVPGDYTIQKVKSANDDGSDEEETDGQADTNGVQKPTRNHENRTDRNGDNRTDNRTDNRKEHRTDSRSGNRPENRSDNRSDNRGENREDGRSEDGERRGRRRSRRGGRGRDRGRDMNREQIAADGAEIETQPVLEMDAGHSDDATPNHKNEKENTSEEKSNRRPRRRDFRKDDKPERKPQAEAAEKTDAVVVDTEVVEGEKPKARKRPRVRRPQTTENAAAGKSAPEKPAGAKTVSETANDVENASDDAATRGPRKRGWWKRITQS